MLGSMSPQHSNRQALVEGALSCLETTPSSQITARQIAAAAEANLGSIGYHFGSTEALLAHAMGEGFRRWLHELATEMGDVADLSPLERIRSASELATGSVGRHEGLVRTFLAAVARAPHDAELRETLAQSYKESRVEVASLLGLGSDESAVNGALLMLATFDGLLIQAILNPDEPITLDELNQGLLRLGSAAQSQDQL
jgi:AcrR family transcriptional regulator